MSVGFWGRLAGGMGASWRGRGPMPGAGGHRPILPIPSLGLLSLSLSLSLSRPKCSQNAVTVGVFVAGRWGGWHFRGYILRPAVGEKLHTAGLRH
jgi:hypothetical protein